MTVQFKALDPSTWFCRETGLPLFAANALRLYRKAAYCFEHGQFAEAHQLVDEAEAAYAEYCEKQRQ